MRTNKAGKLPQKCSRGLKLLLPIDESNVLNACIETFLKGLCSNIFSEEFVNIDYFSCSCQRNDENLNQDHTVYFQTSVRRHFYVAMMVHFLGNFSATGLRMYRINIICTRGCCKNVFSFLSNITA